MTRADTDGPPSALPEPVRRWLPRVLPADGAWPTAVRLTQRGEMVLRPGRRPLPFTAVEELAVGRVAFSWQARFPLVGPLALRVADGYDGRDGLLDVRMLGLPVQRRRGPALAQAEAQRYLAELAWVPQAAVGNRALRWHESDEDCVEVSTDTGGGRAVVRLRFDDHGDLVATSADRPRLEAGGELTAWSGRFGGHVTLGGMRIPARGEVSWELPSGPFTYWRATVTAAEPVR